MQLSLSSSISEVDPKKSDGHNIPNYASRFVIEKLTTQDDYPINRKQATYSAASSCGEVLCGDEGSIY